MSGGKSSLSGGGVASSPGSSQFFNVTQKNGGAWYLIARELRSRGGLTV